jgi:cytochrome c5
MNFRQSWIALIGLSACAVAVAAEETAPFDVAQTYQTTCYACHGTGAAHAPIVGDVIEWEIRLEKGLETVVKNSIDGLNGVMPPRGLCTTGSDEDMRALVEYMLGNL